MRAVDPQYGRSHNEAAMLLKQERAANRALQTALLAQQRDVARLEERLAREDEVVRVAVDQRDLAEADASALRARLVRLEAELDERLRSVKRNESRRQSDALLASARQLRVLGRQLEEATKALAYIARATHTEGVVAGRALDKIVTTIPEEEAYDDPARELLPPIALEPGKDMRAATGFNERGARRRGNKR
jgi:hypothetical protein